MNKTKLGGRQKSSLNAFLNYGIILAAYLILQLLIGRGLLTNSLQSLLVPVCCYIVMAVSLNLVVGISGELSLGHAGFMSLGAFSGIVASMALQSAVPSGILRLVIALLVGGLVGGLGGFIVGVPVLRLRGDYLAIVTLAFGEIIKNIINILYVGMDENGFHIATEEAKLGLAAGKTPIIRGPMGAVGVTKLASFTAGIVLVLIALVVVQNLVRSRTGRAIMALRDNRIAAESVGIHVTRFKLTAFVTSAVLAGAAGALYGLNYSSTVASKFDFNTSILVLVFVVLGGLGSIRGSILAATVLTVLPELLRNGNIKEYRMLIYAVILILVMLLTNNPFLKGQLTRLGRKLKGLFARKSEPKGGAAQ